MRCPLTLAVALLASALVAAQQPSFRARTEVVRLDVLVTDDGAPVAGLRAADFEVRDNGVLQQVRAVDAIEAVQLAVVLDSSGSMTGDRLDLARSATTELLRQLTVRDSATVLAFGSQVGRLAPPGASVDAAVASLGRLAAAGSTSLVDGLYAGVIEAGAGPGPKLVVVMTDGRNNSSWLKAEDVIDVARRHETVVYPVAVGAIEGTQETVNPAFRLSDSLALLRLIADETGGRPIQADWNRELGSVFRRILDEYRQRYILSFTPEGVGSGDGWHTLEVRVKRRGIVVRSRTRYWSGT